MEEKVYEIDMIYIKNSGTGDYQLELASRRGKSVILKFSKVEGLEINASIPLEVKNAFMSCNETGDKIWNMRFGSPANLKINFTGKIIIEVI